MKDEEIAWDSRHGARVRFSSALLPPCKGYAVYPTMAPGWEQPKRGLDCWKHAEIGRKYAIKHDKTIIKQGFCLVSEPRP